MKKIVLIEDDQDLYSLIRYNLEKEGFAVSGLQTGKGALDLCRRERPDLIILDVMLPDSSGLEICKAIRADSELAAVPVIFLTARASEADRIVGLELGANDYIVKPFFVRELIARIKVHFRGPAPVSKLLKCAGLELDRARCRVHLAGQEVSLTATEFRLLEFLMSRPGVVFSRQQLLDAGCGRRSKMKAGRPSSAASAASATASIRKRRASSYNKSIPANPAASAIAAASGPGPPGLRFSMDALYDALASRILILDGAMGTMLQAYKPTAADYGGPKLENCSEILCRTHPEWITAIHRAYLEAGADIIETNSFQGSPLVLAEFGLESQTHELNVLAARLARQAADQFSTPAKPRFVAGSMGPTTKSLTLRGDVTMPQMAESYYAQAKGLIEGGADLLLVETAFDTRNIKAAILGIRRLERDIGAAIPLIISGTIERFGAMLAGQTAEAFCASVAHARPLAIGLNCATGPDLMTDHIRTLAQMAPSRISCYPNAGLPNEEDKYLETPESLAAQLAKFVEHGWLNIVGGCCGTTPAHIKAIAEMAEGKAPRPLPPPSHKTYFSGIELVEAEESNRPLIVGERTNVIGSRLFKQMIAAEKWEEASEIARWQVKNGAHIIDVCLQSSDRDELKDIDPFYARLMPKIKVPVTIDTTDPQAVERALQWCQGKSIINSINLEDGEEKFERVCPIARAYGAALVVGAIDEDPQQAQAFTRERKLEVARRSTRLLTEKYGIPPEDIILDPLVFPCATGDENYIGGAVETIEAIRLIKEQIPYVKTILGISNISFGLPPAAREVVNSVFLYHATKAGLDLAIVNAERLERFPSIPEHERQLAENLLFNTPLPGTDVPADWREQTREQKAAINQFHIAAISDHFRKAGKKEKRRAAELPLDERLANYIIEGSRDP